MTTDRTNYSPSKRIKAAHRAHHHEGGLSSLREFAAKLASSELARDWSRNKKSRLAKRDSAK